MSGRHGALWMMVCAVFAISGCKSPAPAVESECAEEPESIFSDTLLKELGLAVHWQRDLSCGPVRKTYLEAQSVYVESARATLTCVNSKSGIVRWVANMQRELAVPPVEMDGRVAYVSRNHLRILDLGKGEQLKFVRLPGVAPIAPLAYQNGHIYLCATSNRLVKLNVETGADVWTYAKAKHFGSLHRRPLCLGECIVYVTTDDGGTVYCVSDATGDERWAHKIEADPTQPVAAGELILVGASDGSLRALEPKKGELRWQFVAPELLLEPAQVAGDTVILPCRKHGVCALDLKTGEEKWLLEGLDATLIAMGKGRAYLGGRDGVITVVDVKSGERVREVAPQKYTIFAPNTDGFIYLASPKGHLLALKQK